METTSWELLGLHNHLGQLINLPTYLSIYLPIYPIGSVSLENTNNIDPFFTRHSCNHTLLKINIYTVLCFRKKPVCCRLLCRRSLWPHREDQAYASLSGELACNPGWVYSWKMTKLLAKASGKMNPRN